MSVRSAESRSRDNSPDDGPEKRQGKKRKVLSCYACRNRKMKCDRVYPVCGRCQRTGRADQCTYDPRLLEDVPVNGDGHVESSGVGYGVGGADGGSTFASSGGAPADAVAWKMRMQERRLDLLERKLWALGGASKDDLSGPPSRLHTFDTQANEPVFKEEMMFRGKGFKTQFYGSTSPFCLLTSFGELQAFTREALSTDASVARIRADFKGFRNQRKAALKERNQKSHGTDAEIRALVPDKILVDAAAALYFQMFENTYRIIHEPTFWKEYQTFWGQDSEEERSASFAAILILLIAVTKCLSTDQQPVFIGDSSAEREDASNLVDACDSWLLRHSRKHLTIAFFQLQCLSLLAKRVNCIKMKQDWVNSGDVIRLAIAAGMHRDPSLIAFGKVSEYEKEMRRRIWASIMELELQSSIDCGLQSTLCGLFFDNQAPANLPDDAFSMETHQLPASRPLDHYTDTSYLAWSIKSLPFRIHLMQLLNNPTTELQYSDVLDYDNQINSFLSALPTWNDVRAVQSAALLDLQLRQFLLILHRPYARLASTNARFTYSVTSCIKTASAMLGVYETMLAKSIFVLNNSRSDVLRLIMTLAQVVFYISKLSMPEYSSTSTSNPSTAGHAGGVLQSMNVGNPMSQNPPHPPIKIPRLPQTDFLITTLCTSAIELMDRGCVMFESKVMRLGTGYMEGWLISAAIGIMPSTLPSESQNDTEELRARGRKAIDRITGLCFRVLALQKDPGNEFASSLRTSIAKASSPDVRSSDPSTVGVTPITMTSDISMQNFIPGASGMAAALADGDKTGIAMHGQWDGLQDMQVDIGGWNFPDFWSFDLAGDF